MWGRNSTAQSGYNTKRFSMILQCCQFHCHSPKFYWVNREIHYQLTHPLGVFWYILLVQLFTLIWKEANNKKSIWMRKWIKPLIRRLGKILSVIGGNQVGNFSCILFRNQTSHVSILSERKVDDRFFIFWFWTWGWLIITTHQPMTLQPSFDSMF